VRLLAAGIALAALWRSYLPGGVPVRQRRSAGDFADWLAHRSGLVIPLLTHELRSNLAVRLGCIAATLGACLVMIEVRTSDASQASVVVFVAAVAALGLYSLPALCRDTLLGKLHFLAGHPAFARRMRFAAYAIPTALFVIALSVAALFDRSGTALRDASVFSLLFVAGVAGARVGIAAIRWSMPLACMIALIILSAMIGAQ
jgi:FtsH-binding integral membrane protein